MRVFAVGSRRMGALAGLLAFASAIATASVSAQVVQFESASYVLPESRERTEVCLQRTGNVEVRSDALISSRDGTATHELSAGGVDYQPFVEAPVVFFGGSLQTCFLVRVFDDPDPEPDETFTLEIVRVFSPGSIGQRAVATITILDDDTVPEARLVALERRPVEGQAGTGPVVFAPDECFDSSPASDRFELWAELSRPLETEVCAEVSGPNLRLEAEPSCVRFLPGVTLQKASVLCDIGARPPSVVELTGVDAEGVGVGEPSRASVAPCRVRLGGTSQPCAAAAELCASELLFGVLCELGVSRACFGGLGPFESPRTPSAAVARPPVDTLRALRDDTMSASRAGRYYRDLYRELTPQLKSTLLGDFPLLVDLAASYPPWVEALGQLVEGDASAVITSEMAASLLRALDRVEQSAPEPLRSVVTRERARLDLSRLAGQTIDDLVALLEQQGGPLSCATGAESLCLQQGRFRVEVLWQDGKGGGGFGQASRLSEDSGSFWFFDPANVELVVKVLDGRGLNDRFWVFYGALSDVDYTVLVTDTLTGALRAYHNPAGRFASAGDTDAFAPDGSPTESARALGVDLSLGAVLREGVGSLVERGWRTVRSLFGVAVGAAPVATVTAGPAAQTGRAAATCTPGAHALCLNEGRFRVEVTWRDFAGNGGAGQAAPLTADTGTFWFFDPANTELIVKVLDARAINDRFWVYFGALSNVGYTIRVTDTVSGQTRTYDNPLGTFGSRGDTEAF